MSAVSFSKEFFLDEVRDGFFISTMMKRSWAAIMSNYKELEELCLEHGVNCFVVWGTLLGAVRHGGFIPWDDDMDVAMLREYYMLIKSLADKGALPGDHWIDDHMSGENENMKSRWLDTGSTVRNEEDTVGNFGFPFVNIIDIDVVDHIPDDEDERKLYRSIIELIAVIRDNVRDIEAEGGDEASEQIEEKKAQIVAQIVRMSEITGYTVDLHNGNIVIQLLRMMDHYCEGFSSDECRDVSILSYYMSDPSFIFDEESLKECVSVDFENDSVLVPIGYDKLLRTSYGAYANPVIEFDSHDFPYYRGMEADLKEKYGYEFMTYHLYIEEYDRITDARQKRVPLIDLIRDSLGLLREAHDYVESIVSGHNCEKKENQNLEELMEVLSECQNLAVSLGTSIEMRMISGEEVVSVLEKYCEYVYEMYERVSVILADATSNSILEQHIPGDVTPDVMGITDDIESLREYEEILADSLSDVSEKKQVVFLCYRVSHWKSLHTIWERMSDDESVNVIVIAVPYYLREYDGSIDKDEMIIETKGYPDEVILTPYDEYDMQLYHPDEIIYQCPYDEYSSAMSVHPYYYASNLYQFTDKMVFIPPFYTRDITENDKRIRSTLSDFIKNPGLIYADEIRVQSEGVRRAYIDILKSFVREELSGDGELSKGKWEDRVIVTGSAITEWESRGRELFRAEKTGICYASGKHCGREKTSREQNDNSNKNKYKDQTSGDEVIPNMYDEMITIPDDWLDLMKKEDGSFKKVLVYYVSGSMLYSYGIEEVKRAGKLLDIMSAHNNDITVLWHEDKYIRDILYDHNSEAWEQYEALKEWYIEDCMGIYDDTYDDDRAARLADAFFGDVGVVMNKCRSLQKPVMWATPGTPVEG